MWIRYGGDLINTLQFLTFSIREATLFGKDKSGKVHFICQYRDEKQAKAALDMLVSKWGAND